MAHPWTRQDKFKRAVWAAAFAAVVFVGSLTGAQLKADKQKEEVRRRPPRARLCADWC